MVLIRVPALDFARPVDLFLDDSTHFGDREIIARNIGLRSVHGDEQFGRPNLPDPVHQDWSQVRAVIGGEKDWRLKAL
ncbi:MULTISPECIES: hypothetical protein [unclassified Streptomyces]|uniref:hypothetical protein n=1 Tax=unclassified Streptomyces TaxID=2593676 RepID=UPI00381DAB0E